MIIMIKMTIKWFYNWHDQLNDIWQSLMYSFQFPGFANWRRQETLQNARGLHRPSLPLHVGQVVRRQRG